jgi:tetratricopeptide (TPR) repeat protein
MRYLILFLFTAPFALVAQNKLQDAYLAFADENYELTVELVTEVVENEKLAEGYMLRADALHKQSNFINALADYDFAEKLGYSDDDLFQNRGICRSSLGMYDAAEKDLWRHLEIHPENATSHYYLAQIDYMNGLMKDAMEHLEYALKFDDEHMPSWYLKGAAYGEMGDYKKAKQCFERAAALKPEFHRIQLNIALIYLEQLRYADAEFILQELRLADESLVAEVLYYRGEARYFQKDIEGACEDWTEAAALGDEDAQVNYDRICVKQKENLKKKKRTYAEF